MENMMVQGQQEVAVEQNISSRLRGKEEMSAINDICFGTNLSAYPKEQLSSLMLLAAVIHHPHGWMEVPEDRWTIRLAQTAVEKDWNAMRVIPEKYKVYCIKQFCSSSLRLTANDVSAFRELFNSQPYDFIFRTLRTDKAMERFILKDKLAKRQAEAKAQGNTEGEKKQNIEPEKLVSIASEARKRKTNEAEKPGLLPLEDVGNYRFDFSKSLSSAAEDTDPDAFLLSEPKDQSEKRLVAVVSSDNIFRPDFIKQLLIPNRNYGFYLKKGEEDKAEYWKTRVIPYLTARICKIIANAHPEGSAATPEYLTKEAVLMFWKKHPEMTATEKTEMFMRFPEVYLDASMVSEIVVSAEVIRHAPHLLLDTEEAARFLRRYPNQVLYLPSEYQTVARLLNSRVVISQRTLPLIKDREIREKFAAVFGLTNQ